MGLANDAIDMTMHGVPTDAVLLHCFLSSCSTYFHQCRKATGSKLIALFLNPTFKVGSGQLYPNLVIEKLTWLGYLKNISPTCHDTTNVLRPREKQKPFTIASRIIWPNARSGPHFHGAGLICQECRSSRMECISCVEAGK